MKYPIQFLIFFLLLSNQSFSQRSNSNITEQDYYNFYNSIKEPDSINTYILENEPHLDMFRYSLFDTVFDKKDSLFLVSQFKQKINFKWESGKINRAKIIDKGQIDSLFKYGEPDDDWAEFQKEYGKEAFWTFSIPYFSKDRNICMVLMEIRCGALCASIDAYYYKRNGSKWKLVAVVNLLVS